MTMIATKLSAVRQAISAACIQAGRPVDAVQLLAVSKTQTPEALRAAFAAGQTAFGENYVQEALDKMAALADLHLQWHCIGPLQSNKTKPVAEHFDWVHSVDRLKIAQRLSEQRPPDLPPLQICLQVNIDDGPNKSGILPGQALELALAVIALPRLCLRGIMCIPEPVADFAAQKAVHLQAKALFDALTNALAQQQPLAAKHFDTLSIGMSGDMVAAIDSGSTLVRVGSAIFGTRPPK